MNNFDTSRFTPMMQQYMKIKNENKDAILFYRLGDFYEMFFDDALIAARELEIALTARDCGGGQKAPMCGIPHHVAESYLNKLVDKGHKVAVVDQIEDPKLAKGIVKRSITRIVTPGTITDLDGKQKDNNFLLAIFHKSRSFGICYVDITTGELKTTELLNSKDTKDLLDFVVKVNPKEILLNKKIDDKLFNNYCQEKNIFISYIDTPDIDIASSIKQLNSYLEKRIDKSLEKKYFSILSSNMLLDYIYLFQDQPLKHINELNYVEAKNYMKVDASTRANLEIHKSLYDNSRKNSLLSVLDDARTPMGSRKISSWLEFPLLDQEHINYRLDLTEYFVKNLDQSMRLSDYLNQIFDLERIIAKISYAKANAKELLNLKNSIEKLPNIKKELSLSSSEQIKAIGETIDDLRDLYLLIDKSILEEAPVLITEGNLIKEGYSKDLDELKYEAINGKKELIEYEKDLKEITGIKNLKVSYNKNVGYYIELTKSTIKDAPDFFIRRQTLKNSERYMTDRLNEIADKILGSQADTRDLEYRLFVEIRESIANASARIKSTTDIIAKLDAILSFARIAKNNNYVRPIFNTKDYIDIREGRHPVVERTLDIASFVPNDSQIGLDDDRIKIITGPNMAGKSTYMRQMALIVLMAQIGSFVPAKHCDICISDAIFTRIGASDNLAKGDSTFMVEMKEMSNIINNATVNSFIILDEVGRGTSTNDGLSIAIAIVEYLSKNLKAKTYFATHYHELTQIAERLDNVSNLKVDILEENGDLIFLRKIMPGSADKSYGIEVAKLSGIPIKIIDRANQILKSMENKNIDFVYEPAKQMFMNFENLEKDLLLREIKSLDLDEMTAKQAYDMLYDLKNRAGDLFED
ncbi:MAG: DNA mismatch repair protein MutS [Tissierellia bacterium]|nr:DNA mismatch repair protein MutS [Tissierellia bacterium]